MHAALLGDPAAHSLSPLLHTAAYDALGLDGWRYHAIRCSAGDLGPLLSRIRDSGRWAGLSLTMPLKEIVVDLLDEVQTELRAVNTVVVRDGRLVGHNTDVDGIEAGLVALGYDGGPVAVLGAGGTARAALAAVRRLGATEVTLHARSPERAGATAEVGRALGLSVRVAALPDVAPGTTVVSTLPASAPVEGRAGGPLLDAVYAPWPTPRATGARSAGFAVVGGHAVLLGQAAAQVELMTGRPAPLAAMRAALA